MFSRWNADDIEDRVMRAARLGIDQTTAAMVLHAKQNHPWRNVTGLAEGSIQMRPARLDGDTVVGEFGSYGVTYFIWLELGTATRPAMPSLRPAFDAEAPGLVERIREAYARMT